MAREFAIVPPGKPTWFTLLGLAFVLPVSVLAIIALTTPAGEVAKVLSTLAMALCVSVAVAVGLFLSLRRLGVSIEGERLVVRAALYTRRVPLGDLDVEAARIVDLGQTSEWRPAVRMNGIGLPGASMGYFRARPFSRKVFCVLTSRQRVLVLPERTGDQGLLLSLEKPQALMEALKGRR